MFRYVISTWACARNPAADLREALKPVPTRHFAAIVDPKGVKNLLRDLVAYKGNPITRAALRLSALLLLRPGELRSLEWSWVDFETATLTLPSAVMKRRLNEKANGQPHIVPMAAQVNALVESYAAGEILGISNYSNIQAWLARGLARPAVQRGLRIPARPA